MPSASGRDRIDNLLPSRKSQLVAKGIRRMATSRKSQVVVNEIGQRPTPQIPKQLPARPDFVPQDHPASWYTGAPCWWEIGDSNGA